MWWSGLICVKDKDSWERASQNGISQDSLRNGFTEVEAVKRVAGMSTLRTQKNIFGIGVVYHSKKKVVIRIP